MLLVCLVPLSHVQACGPQQALGHIMQGEGRAQEGMANGASLPFYRPLRLFLATGRYITGPLGQWTDDEGFPWRETPFLSLAWGSLMQPVSPKSLPTSAPLVLGLQVRLPFLTFTWVLKLNLG